MYLNENLSNLNNSTDAVNNLRASLSTTTIQTNIISSNSLQSMGSNSNLNKLTIGIQNAACKCKICGNCIAAMRCTECLGIQFCYACDNMYHRHPKRKHHIRKSINLVS